MHAGNIKKYHLELILTWLLGKILIRSGAIGGSTTFIDGVIEKSTKFRPLS